MMVVISCQNMVVTIMNKRIFLFNFFLQKMLVIKKLFMGFFLFYSIYGFFYFKQNGKQYTRVSPSLAASSGGVQSTNCGRLGPARFSSMVHNDFQTALV